MNHLTKLFAFTFFFCVNCTVLKAQQKHFIYVQSENRQQFAIVLNGKVFSSSDYGYIIIPKLSDGDYTFTISFPLNKFPDQSFTCTINKKDAGFFLRNSAAGWALLEMQTQKPVQNNSKDVAQQDVFGSMLSDVVNDPGLTKKDIPVNNNPAAAVAAAGTFATTQAGDTLALDNATFIQDSVYQPEKIAESALDSGTSMLFVDKTQHGTDTISVFVPAEATTGDLAANKEPVPENRADDMPNDKAVAIVPPVSNEPASTGITQSPAAKDATNDNVAGADTPANEEVSNPFYKPEPNNSTATTIQNPDDPSLTSPANNGVNQDCSDMLSDEELNKLKRKMFVKDDDNDMIQYALKYVTKKCITTDQVKILGSLFSSDDGRYNLYDAMYKHVYDYGNYPRLAELIIDPYYKKRFAALLR